MPALVKKMQLGLGGLKIGTELKPIIYDMKETYKTIEYEWLTRATKDVMTYTVNKLKLIKQ